MHNAVAPASIVRHFVSIIAFFETPNESVAANASAHAWFRPIAGPGCLNLTGDATPVAGSIVAIIAGLVAPNNAVATLAVAHTGHSITNPILFNLAISITTIIRGRISVITRLICLKNAVPADLCADELIFEKGEPLGKQDVGQYFR